MEKEVAGMVAIVDYGVGNLFSLSSSLKYIGVPCVITDDPGVLGAARSIILPGVGAFGDAVSKLRQKGLDSVLLAEVQKGKPLLGICLGMQLLYEVGYEYGEHKGLGLIKGSVNRLTAGLLGGPLKVPHMGWNSLALKKDSPLLKYTREGDFVYYVHSYYAPVSAATVASSRYGEAEVTGAVQEGLVFGTQFHPEKSGPAGLSVLKAFTEIGG